MKRTIAIFLSVLTTAVLLTGCTGADTNVSTTPNGTVNGGEPYADAAPEYPENRAPENNTGSQDHQDSRDTEDRPMENFGKDMKDSAENAMEDMEQAVDDAMDGRSGTGMTGGR